MAMGSAGGGGGRRGNRRTKRKAALSEINVTPMVDVMLVLLIIFMISAPLLTSGVKVDLPKTEAAALKDEGDPLTVSIKADGSIFVMDDPASYDQLIPRLMAMTNNDTDKPIYVRADAKTPYENVAQVTAKLSTSGFVHLNLLSDPMSKGAKVSVAASSPAASSGAAAQ